ncbi:MAG: helix-hairpin-helix domain-containing protein [Clostridia bacterium]
MQTNPYSLADHIQGIGFRKADQIAQQIGIPLESPHRIRSAVKYILRESSGEGHVFLPLDLLEDRVYQLIGVTGIQAENALTELIMEGDVVEKEETGQMRVYLTSFIRREQGIARRPVEFGRGTAGHSAGGKS